MYNIYELCFHDLYRVKILSQIKLQTMENTEIEGMMNVEKGKLKHKFALLTDNDQLLDEGNKEEARGRRQINLGQTGKELNLRITSL